MVDDEDEKFSYDSSVKISWESRKIHHGAEVTTMDPDDEDFLANKLNSGILIRKQSLSRSVIQLIRLGSILRFVW